MSRYAIGLGSNQGDRLDNLASAVEDLRAIGDVIAVSSLYETEPVGGPDQDPFLNAVVIVGGELGPIELLDRLQEVELAHGRERTVRWGPRTLDLDILSSDTGPMDTDRLVLPHPRAAERGFVLRPLCDIWPDAMVAPGQTAKAALQSVGDDAVDRLERDWLPPVDPWPGRLLVGAQFALFILAAIGLIYDGSLPGGGVTAWAVLGAVLIVLGVVMALTASMSLGPAMTVHPVPREGARLVDAGPYRFVRHPIYGGVLLTLVGASLFLGSMWGVVVSFVLGVLFWFKSSYEERQLRIRYARYGAYIAAVPRRLIPLLF